MFVTVSEKLFKMIDFDTLRVRHAGREVLASGFCSFYYSQS